ncbi:hypothetical protein O181_018593 [Austropuccinia psidii MF-1]|uniref:CCHC-type domain-containing protein n=1 Tax=Austropuccinia psidii MF-1 TaxID=1389203 RepID=A0A9Q3C854_9BASI|nr:hypothetical protein [Austropuccinia psidii MF-1]
MNIQMRNHKLLTQLPGELEHAVKCRCNQNCTLDDIANILQDIRKKPTVGKFIPYKRSAFNKKQPFRVEFKYKPKERVAEVAKKRNSCHNCGSTDHYANNCPKAKKKFYAIEKVPEEESTTEDYESYSMGDAIREPSDDDQDPREEFLLEYQEGTPLEIQDIQLEAGMPQDTANKTLCKHSQDAQTFLVTPTRGMAYIHGTATKITLCIDNSQHQLIIDSGTHCSIVARNYLDNHFPNWGKQLFPTKARNFKSTSGKMTSIGTIIKEIIIPHRKGNIRLNPELVVLDDAHIQGFLLGTDYQRMYGIDIHNSKNRHLTNGTHREKKLRLYKYQISTCDPLEESLNEFREAQFSTTLTRNQKPLGKIKGHDQELYLDVERPHPPMLRRHPYPESPETRKEIEKHINELLDMDVIRNIGHNEIVEITTPVLITWHEVNSRLCGDFRALNNYTKAHRQLKYSEARYGATQNECLCLVWALEKLHYYLEGAVFEVYTDCTALKYLLSMKTTNRHMLRWQIAIQEDRGNMANIYKEGKSHHNADGLSRWPLDNVRSNPAYDPDVAAKIPIQFMEIDGRKSFRFSE